MIELLIVMAIIGILATLTLPNFLGAQDKAKEVAIKAVVHTYQNALENYQLDNSNYPTGTNQALSALYTSLNTAGYLSSAPQNPFTGTDYTATDTAGKIIYSYDPTTGVYTLTAYQRDGTTILMTATNN